MRRFLRGTGINENCCRDEEGIFKFKNIHADKNTINMIRKKWTLPL